MEIIGKVVSHIPRLWQDSVWVWLMLRFKLAGGPYFNRFSFGKLPFTGDWDLQELFYYRFGEMWYQNDLRILQPYLKEGITVVDVGANQGFFSLMASRLIGPKGAVLALEPSQSTFEKLLMVIEENRLSNVSALNTGCGEKAGEIELFTVTRSSGTASIRPSTQGASRPVGRITLKPLDQIVEEKNLEVDFLKIDTEGYEDEVLKGAIKILQQHRPVVFLELSSEYAISSKSAIEILLKNGYEFPIVPDLTVAKNGDNFFAVPIANWVPVK